jgi:peroxiredoxin
MPETNRDGPVVGQTAPDFGLETASGESVRLSGLRGRHVVLFFVREFT